MAENVENQTIKLLQDMRKEMREEFQSVREDIKETHRRIDGTMYILTLMAADFAQNDDRIDKLEELTADLKARIDENT